MSECIFCKIAAGEMPALQVYANDKVVAFLDNHPCVKGHTVVIPKRHGANILEFSDDELKDIFAGVKAATQKIKDALPVESFNIGLNHGPASGQSINHLHIHILPRWPNDGGGSMHTIVRKASDESVEEVFKKIIES